MGIKHAKQDGLPADDGSSSHIRPSDWYAEHATTETDTTKRLAPDGAGGMTWSTASVPVESAAAKLYAYNTFR